MATYKPVILSGTAFQKSDKTTNVKIRITHHGKQLYVSTKFFVPVDTEKKTYWDSATGRAKNFPRAKTINDGLILILSQYIKEEARLDDKADLMNVAELKAHLTRKKQRGIDFIVFAQKTINQLKAENKANTAQWHETMLTVLKKYINATTIDISLITADFLRTFEQWMLTGDEKILRKPMSPGGVENYMRSLRSLFNQARDQYNDESAGIIRVTNYPFRSYKMPAVKRRQQGKSLSVSEIRKLYYSKYENKYARFAADMFMLQFFLIGINAKDLYELEKPKGKRIEYVRSKTAKDYSIFQIREAKKIIARYRGKTKLLNLNRKFSSYRTFTWQLDKHLKQVAKDIGCSVSLSSNCARHTWATIARNDCRIAKSDVALCLGHEDGDNKITDTYLNYDYSIHDECNQKVIDFVLNTDI